MGNVIDTAFFTPEHPWQTAHAGPARLLVVARLVPQKGIDTLMEALALLSGRGVAATLEIGGDGPDRKSLERRAIALGIRDRCSFLGQLDRDQVRAACRRCDLFVLPSFHETFGVAAAEAMACGRRAIVTACGGPEDFVEAPLGAVVPPRDAARLAEAIARALADPTRDPAEIHAHIDSRFGPLAFVSRISAIYQDLWDAAARATFRRG